MKRTLLVLRHGKSDWEAECNTDFDRPLTKRGQKSAKFMGRFIAEQGLHPQVVISSPANRALSTAKLIAKQLGDVERLSYDLLYLADPDEYYDVLATVGDDVPCVLVVGHNPGLENLVDDLGSLDDTVLKTCSLAVVQFGHCSWGKLDEEQGKRAGLYHPRELMG